jgi:sec-independent protein translocase protein TatB
VIIFLVALVVLGPDKLPQVARVLGKTMAEFRRITADFRTTIEGEVREMERQAEIRQAAAAAQAELNTALESVGSVAHDVSQTGVEPRSQSDLLSDSTRAVPETTLPPEPQEPPQPQEPVAANAPASPEKLTNG